MLNDVGTQDVSNVCYCTTGLGVVIACDCVGVYVANVRIEDANLDNRPNRCCL
jgi:hypothetical protein